MNCNLCQETKYKTYLNPYHWRKTKQIFSVVECENCGHLYTKDAPSEDAIGAYYDSETYISHTDSNKSLFDKVYNGIKKYMLAKKYAWITRFVPRGTLIDYGAGSGAFVKYVADRGRKAIGLEIAEAGRKTAKELYGIELYEPNELKNMDDESVSVFTMWHVLEHIYQPEKLIKEIHRVLDKNGVLVVAVPNPLSWDAKHYKEDWAAWDVPIHISHFKPSVIKNFMEKNEFHCIQTKGMPFDAFYISLVSNENKYGHKKPITGFINGLKSQLHGIKTGNYSSQVYIFRKN